MNYQTVRLVSTFGSGSCVSTFGSGSCVSSFGSSPKVETAAVSSFGLTQKWKLRTRFQFWAVSTFGPAVQCSFCKQVTLFWRDNIKLKDSDKKITCRKNKRLINAIKSALKSLRVGGETGARPTPRTGSSGLAKRFSGLH